MSSTTDMLIALWDALASFGLPVLAVVVVAVVVRAAVRARRPRDWRAKRGAEQLRAVGASRFERRPLLNREEARLLPVLERAVREAGQGHRVMAQTSLGEVIRPVGRETAEAFAAINSKRLDFAIFDRTGLIACAVEYQGTGHYQGGAEHRDTVKREALRKAGVRLLEVHPDFTEEGLRREVGDVLRASARS